MHKSMKRITVKEEAQREEDRRAHKFADSFEWLVLLVIFGFALFFVFSHNGFIDSSGIQPYPY
jgi:hypothetical protein